ncbi:phosphate ABC transporter substrate-binding protein [Bacillaceae bacterium Marseille-Q3522]|nr:phosphate ABC transporter substrate-binding protein [Bacillaceae bacterium Marseille-Q3522]
MKKVKSLLLLSIIAAMTIFVAACGGNTDDTGNEDNGNNDSGSNETAELSGSLTVSGSSAMQPLVAAAAEEFMAEHPDVDITVNAGGSGQGLTDVSEDTVNIGNSDVFAEEKDGIPAEDLVDHQIAVVGMAAAVHPGVGIDDISQDDLIRVFTGEVTNWSELGGEDIDITLVNRPDSSGTRATFVKYALNGETPAEGITEEQSGNVKQIISETEGAIGYLALSYFDDDSVVALAIDGVEATAENIQSGDFPIWAYQHSYTNGEPDELEQAFLEYLVSDAVQTTIIPDEGYISISDMEVERDAEGNIK